MKKTFLLFVTLLALLSGCERYQVISRGSGESGGVVYLKDNYTGKIYFVRATEVLEVPLP